MNARSDHDLGFLLLLLLGEEARQAVAVHERSGGDREEASEHAHAREKEGFGGSELRRHHGREDAECEQDGVRMHRVSVFHSLHQIFFFGRPDVAPLARQHTYGRVRGNAPNMDDGHPCAARARARLGRGATLVHARRQRRRRAALPRAADAHRAVHERVRRGHGRKVRRQADLRL
ncbi:MAG: hypothetical protein CL862_00425 [Cyanobium sp. NAT70]|nr:hypothetical protein [Cyanobium sp. NAT70]